MGSLEDKQGNGGKFLENIWHPCIFCSCHLRLLVCISGIKMSKTATAYIVDAFSLKGTLEADEPPFPVLIRLVRGTILSPSLSPISHYVPLLLLIQVFI